jgi:hypothetical protein
MKLMKAKTPLDSYVVTIRNGVRLSESGTHSDGDGLEVLGWESELEAFEAMRAPLEAPGPASNPEPG